MGIEQSSEGIKTYDVTINSDGTFAYKKEIVEPLSTPKEKIVEPLPALTIIEERDEIVETFPTLTLIEEFDETFLILTLIEEEFDETLPISTLIKEIANTLTIIEKFDEPLSTSKEEGEKFVKPHFTPTPEEGKEIVKPLTQTGEGKEIVEPHFTSTPEEGKEIVEPHFTLKVEKFVEPLPKKKKLESSSTICPSGSGNLQFDPSQFQQHAHPLTFNTDSNSIKTPTWEISSPSSSYLFGQQPTVTKSSLGQQSTVYPSGSGNLQFDPSQFQQHAHPLTFNTDSNCFKTPTWEISSPSSSYLFGQQPTVTKSSLGQQSTVTKSSLGQQPITTLEMSTPTVPAPVVPVAIIPKSNPIFKETHSLPKNQEKFQGQKNNPKHRGQNENEALYKDPSPSSCAESEDRNPKDGKKSHKPHYIPKHKKSHKPHHQKKPATVHTPQKRLNDAKNLELLIDVYQIIDEELIAQQGILGKLNRDRSTTKMSGILMGCRSLVSTQISVSQTLMKNCQGIVDSVSGIIPEGDLTIKKYADIIQNNSGVSKQLEWGVALGSCLLYPAGFSLPLTHMQRVQLFAKTLQEISDRAILFAANDIAWDKDTEILQMLARFKSKL